MQNLFLRTDYSDMDSDLLLLTIPDDMTYNDLICFIDRTRIKLIERTLEDNCFTILDCEGYNIKALMKEVTRLKPEIKYIVLGCNTYNFDKGL